MPPRFPSPLKCEVEEIRGVYLLERKRLGESFVTSSPPGHLLHFLIEGGVRQRCNGREYDLRRGDMLWYHENECVEGHCAAAPWRFYSVVFDAPLLPPPDFSHRSARPSWGRTKTLFADLYAGWNDASDGAFRRSLRCHSALAEILLLHNPLATTPEESFQADWLIQLWWNIENQVRQNLSRSYRLKDLASIAQTSPATVHRASMAAVHLPPVRRIKMLRLEMARGLLVYSKLSITEIAERTGYERVNELSRDIRKEFGSSPSQIRNS